MAVDGSPLWLLLVLAVISPFGAIMVAYLGPRQMDKTESVKWLRDSRLSAYLELIDRTTDLRNAQTELNRSNVTDRKAALRLVYGGYLAVQKASHRVQILGPVEIAACAAAILQKSWEWTSHGYEKGPRGVEDLQGYNLNLELKQLEKDFLETSLEALKADR